MELETRETKITVDFLSYNQSAFSKKANLNETCLQSLHKLPLRSRIVFFFVPLYTIFVHSLLDVLAESLAPSAAQTTSGETTEKS